MKINNAVSQMRSDPKNSWENMWFATIVFLIFIVVCIASAFGGPAFTGMLAVTGLVSFSYLIPTIYYWIKFIKLIQ
jgi:hypothetical protein